MTLCIVNQRVEEAKIISIQVCRLCWLGIQLNSMDLQTPSLVLLQTPHVLHVDVL
jgi:hypothetical protein